MLSKQVKTGLMSTLEKKLDDLIAKADHVRPEDVTLEYIRRVRDKNDNVPYDFSTQYGGFHRRNGRGLTAHESKEIVTAAYRFLGRFSRHR